MRIRFPDSPVLLLPGVFENPHFLDPLGAVLRTSGRPVLRIPELLRNRATIHDTALTVRTFIEHADLEGITIVAHSKGGLVGKQLMVWPETTSRITSMVAVATPFRGSRYARYTPTRVLRDFSPADATVRDLAANNLANERIVSVFGRLDPQIPDPGLLIGSRNVPLSTSGHFRILADRTLHRLLLEQLAADRVTE
jgi:pimeloyl-ACP methyl ester carboxylesterase